METTLKPRRDSILCHSGTHELCDKCECKCHFDTEPKNLTLENLAYELWTAGHKLQKLDSLEREDVIYRSISRAMGLVDFRGLPPQEVYDRLQPTLSRDYWSLRETTVELGSSLEEYFAKA